MRVQAARHPDAAAGGNADRNDNNDNREEQQ